MKIIGFETDEFYNRKLSELDGEDFLLLVRYDRRHDRWYMNILDTQREVIASGLKITPGDIDMLQRLATEGLPPGRLFISDKGGLGETATLEGLGVTNVLHYLDVEEVKILDDLAITLGDLLPTVVVL